ncbi:MAG: hypothetical protein AVO35_02420 [Candidatus Aegiribacteria sp. MLS_C]|nr:MAG: hypothetical protein AVO35_02420 [Candidatus Aegiribacteria sp. MLS_C]
MSASAGVELKVGPSLGVLLPGDIDGAPVSPGPGIYYGGTGEHRFGSILSAEVGFGLALDMGHPPGEDSQGFPEYDVLDGDLVAGTAALVADLAAFSVSAGIGYYYVYMEWTENLTGESVERMDLEKQGLGYSLALGVNPADLIDVRFTMHFPDMEHMWGTLTLNWKPLEI